MASFLPFLIFAIGPHHPESQVPWSHEGAARDGLYFFVACKFLSITQAFVIGSWRLLLKQDNDALSKCLEVCNVSTEVLTLSL